MIKLLLFWIIIWLKKNVGWEKVSAGQKSIVNYLLKGNVEFMGTQTNPGPYLVPMRG